MALTLLEWFGHDLTLESRQAKADRIAARCPFIDDDCTKLLRDGKSGVCSVELGDGSDVIICPNRMYADSYRILTDVADAAFGGSRRVIHPSQMKEANHDGNNVVAFGKRYGGELRLPAVGGRRSYFVDWVLARIDETGSLTEFVAVEVQTIDTTGSYSPAVRELRAGASGYQKVSKAGLNWENVNKRILPQLIYKGHVLRREPLCTKGLFFVCPQAVFDRVNERLGNSMMPYDNLQPGSLTFMSYELGPVQRDERVLNRSGVFSTTVDQVALAFTSPQNLPAAGVYETAIRNALAEA